jgi:hypothetical protein
MKRVIISVAVGEDHILPIVTNFERSVQKFSFFAVLLCFCLGASSTTVADTFNRMAMLSRYDTNAPEMGTLQLHNVDSSTGYDDIDFLRRPDGKYALPVKAHSFPYGYDGPIHLFRGLVNIDLHNPGRSQVQWLQDWQFDNNTCQPYTYVKPQLFTAMSGQEQVYLNAHGSVLDNYVPLYDGSCMVASIMQLPPAGTSLDGLLTGASSSLGLTRASASPQWAAAFQDVGPGELVGAKQGSNESSYATDMHRCASGKGVSVRKVNNTTGQETIVYESLVLRTLEEPANAYLKRSFYPNSYDGGLTVVGWGLDAQGSGGAEESDYALTRAEIISPSPANMAGDSSAQPLRLRIQHEQMAGDHDASQATRGSADGRTIMGDLLKANTQPATGWTQTAMFVASRPANTSQDFTLQQIPLPQVPGANRSYQSCGWKGISDDGRRSIALCSEYIDGNFSSALVIYSKQTNGQYMLEKQINSGGQSFYARALGVNVKIRSFESGAGISPDGNKIASNVWVDTMNQLPWGHTCFWGCSATVIFH